MDATPFVYHKANLVLTYSIQLIVREAKHDMFNMCEIHDKKLKYVETHI